MFTQDSKNFNTKTIIAYGIAAFFVIIALWFVLSYVQMGGYTYDYRLDGDWSVYVDDKLIAENVSISEVDFGMNKRLTVCDLYTVIPENLPDKQTIELKVYLCSTEAFVDGEKIYDYASDKISKNTMIGSAIQYIPLPDNSAGRELHLRLILNEDNAMTSIPIPRVSNSYTILNNFAAEQSVNCVIGCFLMCLGVVLFLIGFFAMFANSIFIQVVLIGIFSFIMGFWSILTNRVMQLFSLNYDLNSTLEYMMLYFAPTVFGGIMWCMRKDDKTWRMWIIRICTITVGLFAVVTTILHFTNIARFPSTLTYLHALGLVIIAALAYAVFFSVKNKTRSEVVTAMAVIMLIALLGFDIIRFNIQKYAMPWSSIINNSIVPLASMSFIVMLIISYLVHLYDLVMTRAEKEALTELAFRDILTGSFNRAKFDDTMKSIDESGADFALINLDLNGLKAVNDKYGHAEGDILIQIFARILREAFEKCGMTFRVGGDEFVVLLDYTHFGSIEGCLEKLKEYEKAESKNHIFDIDVSYGIAYKNESEDGLVKSVYSIADARMYEMKETVHTSRSYKTEE